MDWKRFFKALFFIFVLAFGFAQPAFGQTGTVVRVSPDYQEVDPGETFTVAIVVENVVDLWAFDVVIDYNPAIISFEHSEFGDFLEEGMAAPVTSEPGRISCGMTQITSDDSEPDPEPKSGSGVLCTLTFVAGTTDGESDLTLNEAILSDRNGVEIDHLTGDGFVQIGEPKSDSAVYIPLFLAGGGK